MLTGPITAFQGVPYGATRVDVELLSGACHFGDSGRVVGLLDLPLSLAVDTALLPVALAANVPSLFERKAPRPTPCPPVEEASSSDAAHAPTWWEVAFSTFELEAHPSVLLTCGSVDSLRLADEQRVPDRGELLLSGPQGEALVWVTCWDDPELAWAQQGLRTVSHRGQQVSFVLWTERGERIDLLRSR